MVMLLRKVSQGLGFLVVLSTLFLILSISSYNLDDPANNFYVSHSRHTVHNYGGVMGAVLADWTLQALGCTVTLFIGMAILSAWWLLLGRVGAAAAVCWRGLFCLVAGSAWVHLTYTTQDPLWGTAMAAGGISGQWLAESLVTYLSRPGAYVILSLMVLGMVSIGVDYPRLPALWRWGLRLWQRCRTITQHASPEYEATETALQEMAVRATHPRRVRPLPLPSDTTLAEPSLDAVESESSSDSVSSETPSDLLSPVLSAQQAPTEAGPARTAVASPASAVPVVQASASSPVPSASPLLSATVSPVRMPGRRRPIVVPQLPSHAVAQSASVSESPPRPSPLPLPTRPVRPPTLLPAAEVSPQPATHQPQRLAPAPPVQLADRDITLPSLDLLDTPAASQRTHSATELDGQARFLEQKLREFGVEGEVVQVLPGPVITMYEFAPAAGVKVNRIVSLQDDLALVMEAVSVRVVAPIPGKAVVGIEIPHKRRETVRLRDLLASAALRASTSKLSLALGKDILGDPVITDLALIPHLLIAGATGSGKSVGLNSLICSLLFRTTPADVKMIMIDPKMLEFSVYDGIPHLLVPVVTDPKRAAVVLRRVVEEMGRRYQLLAAQGVRSIAQYNQQIEEAQQRGAGSRSPSQPEKLPYLVVVIDELSDLMMVSAREVEDSLMRLAQMARAAGIHLMVATQRPSVDVLTGVIKANFPARLSFQVTSKVDSRTILDTNGAETLLGRGDMLFLAPGTSKPQRLHGAYVSEAEIGRLFQAWKTLAPTYYDETFLSPESDRASLADEEYDEKYDEAVELVAKTGQASISMLQRRLRVGYNRAARMIEMMEKVGVVGPADGVKPREVLVRNTFDAP